MRTLTANGNNGSKWIRKERRLAIYLRDRFACIYCLRDLHGADPKDVTLDHVDGVHAVGHHGAENLVTACRSCNTRKGNLPLNRVCGPETIAHIRRNTRRSLKSYMKLAKAILAGDFSTDEALSATN